MLEYVSMIVAVLEAIALYFLFSDRKELNKMLKGYQRDFERIRKEQETERKIYEFNLDHWRSRAFKAENEPDLCNEFPRKLSEQCDALRSEIAKLKKGKKNA